MRRPMAIRNGRVYFFLYTYLFLCVRSLGLQSEDNENFEIRNLLKRVLEGDIFMDNFRE